MTTISLQRSDERHHTRLDWLDSKHNFNFGPHYSPQHTGHGLLLVNNDDRVPGGVGFGEHGHRDMEIVTWVLSGRLEHRDSEGNHGVLYPGLAQRMSAGRGIRHSEMNASPDEPVHFIQMWVPPHATGIDPGYEQLDVNDALASGQLVPIASGTGHADAITIHQRDAVLYGARVAPGATIESPVSTHVHFFAALGGGSLTVDEHDAELAEGDAARLTDPSSIRFTAGADGAELLVWVMA